MSLTVANGDIVTVHQESGAEVTFYPDGAGGFEAPPRAVATLVRNSPDGSYSFSRCDRTKIEFSSTGQLVSVADRNGHPTTLQYSAGKLATVTDSDGIRQLAVTWTGAHITSVSSAGRSVSFAYNDGAGNLTDYTDVGGGVWHFTYDGHLLKTMRRPRQAGVTNPPVVTNVYDTLGRVTSQTDELQRPTSFDYATVSPTVSRTTVTDPDQHVTVEEYTNYVRTKLTRGVAPNASTWLFETDPYTLGITKVTDPLSTGPLDRVTRATYDRHGNMTSYTDALGHGASATYNGFDEPLTVTDLNGVTTTYVYDANGNPTSVARPLLDANKATIATQTTAFAVDTAAATAGDVTSVTDPKGKLWLQQAFNAAGQPTRRVDPLGNTTRDGFDATTGWLTSEVSPRGSAAGTLAGCTPPAMGCTALLRDAFGRATTVTDANGHLATNHYDADGNLDQSVDADLNPTTFIYDAAGQQTELRRADSPQTILKTAYFGDGSLKSTTDGANNATNYTYDSQGRLATATDPDGHKTTYGYDPAGNLVTKADHGGTCPTWPITYPPTLSASAKCTVLGYDAADRVTSMTYSDGVTPNVTNIAYDNVGRRTDMTTGPLTSHWIWDSLGRLKETSTDGVDNKVSYGYANLRDPATSITYPGTPARTLTREFDDAGTMFRETDWLGNVTNFEPDADANLAKTVFPTASGLSDTYAYDNADQLSSITDKSGTTTRSSLTYGRDNAGQVTTVASVGEPADNHAYGYTKLNQLKTVDSATLTYDAADNPTRTRAGTYQAFDAANQLCWSAPTTGTCAAPPAGATTYGYDTRGNRTSIAPAGLAATTLSYDQANRLTKSAPTAPNKGQYSPLTPARVLDTRAGINTGTCGGATCSTLAAGQTLTLQVGGQGGVPASGAAAAVLSVVAVVPTAYGYLGVWAGDDAQPATSTLNWAPYQTTSNLVTAKLAANGTVKLYNGSAGTVELVIDVDGWYAASDGAPGSGFNAINSARILDTRLQQGVCPASTCATIAPGTTLKLKVAGQGGLPASGASAVAVNLTVTNSPYEGWLAVWASNEARPPTASINFAAGATVSELVTSKVAPDGTVSIYNGAPTNVDVIGDVFGWYAAGSGSAFQTVSPARILDTRAGVNIGSCAGPCATLSSGATLVLHVAGQGGVPATGATAVAVNITAINGGPVGYLTVWPTDAPQPATAQLLYAPGQVIGNAAMAKLAADGTISIAAASGPVDLIVDITGYFVNQVPTVTYTYDGDGLRATKTVGSTTARFTWDRSSAIPKLLDDGTNSYVYGSDGLPLEQVARDNTVTWFHHDQLGSTRSLTNASGVVVGTASYDPYGNPTAQTGLRSSLGFAGEYTDAETGFVYLRARYYDPATEQFLSVDPAYLLTGSRYGYVDGNPLNGTDPSGLDPCAMPLEPVLVMSCGPPQAGREVLGQPGAARGPVNTGNPPAPDLWGRLITRPAPPSVTVDCEVRTNGEPGGSPALDDNPWGPAEVSRRQSDLRRQLGINQDPDTPIPDQSPGENIKGTHSADPRISHAGERNVGGPEEHSRVPKGSNAQPRR